MLRIPSSPVTLRNHPSNRLGLDYAREASSLPALGYGIIDVHAHINGLEAAALWAPIARAYGVERTY